MKCWHLILIGLVVCAIGAYLLSLLIGWISDPSNTADIINNINQYGKEVQEQLH